MATLSRRERTRATRKATEAALIAAATQLLDEGTPFAELGIDQIVRAAGFSRPTFYAYFRDKRELVLRMGLALEADLATAADPWLESEHNELRPTLVAVLETFRAHGATVGALVEAATYDPAVAELWRGLHTRFLPIAQERIRRSDPSLGEPRAAARAYALVWMTERTLTDHLANRTVDEAALLDELTRFWQQATGGATSGATRETTALGSAAD